MVSKGGYDRAPFHLVPHRHFATGNLGPHLMLEQENVVSLSVVLLPLSQGHTTLFLQVLLQLEELKLATVTNFTLDIIEVLRD